MALGATFAETTWHFMLFSIKAMRHTVEVYPTGDKLCVA